MKAVFYYGFSVDATSNTIRVDEGSGDVDITLKTGNFTLSDYVEMVSNKLNEALTGEYLVVVDRDTRLITISSNLSFELKVLDIFPLNSGFPVMGFNEAINLPSQTTHTGDSPSGMAYFPQFELQDIILPGYNKEYIDAAVKDSPSGELEVVSFGLIEYLEFNIKNITNYKMPFGAPIESNEAGLEDAISFMDYCIKKAPLEFMANREDRETYSNILLESTRDNRLGVGYTLKENFQALGYFETGSLKYRVL